MYASSIIRFQYSIFSLPQGGKAPSLLVYLYLCYYECTTACKNVVFYRYIDDDIIYDLNNYNFINFPIFYPVNRTLRENRIVFKSINFLDLRISINISSV